MQQLIGDPMTLLPIYHVSFILRQVFFPLKNNPKGLDPSCKTDLNLWGCSGREKNIFVAELYKTDLHLCGYFGRLNSRCPSLSCPLDRLPVPGYSTPHPGYLHPRGTISRLVYLAPGGEDKPAGLSCPPGVKINQPGYLAPHP